MAMRSHLLLLLLVLNAAIALAAAQRRCEQLNLDAPERVTLFQSTQNASEAVILHPDCTFKSVSTTLGDGGTVELVVNASEIADVVSYPSCGRIYLDSNPIERADFSADTVIFHVILAWCDLTSLEDITIGPNVNELDFDGNELTAIPAGKIPASVRYLYLSNGGHESMDQIEVPGSVEHLYLGNNELTNISFTLPTNIVELVVDENKIPKLENLVLPDSLETLSCTNCGVTTIRGVKFPIALTALDLSENRIADFEIRESDRVVFEKLETFAAVVQQTTCTDTSATKLSLQGGIEICVISDDHFNQKYPALFDTRSSSNSPANSSTGGTGSDNNTLIVVVICVGGVILLAIAFAVYRAFYSSSSGGKHSSRRHGKKRFSLQSTSSHLFQSNEEDSSEGFAREYLSNDVRNDERLIASRIAQSEILVVDRIATGGFGVIHLATYRGREVAVKQVLPEKSKNLKIVKGFMDEIRLCASLEHPKIVEFVGVAWSTLLDVAVIIEYMCAGDLSSILRSHCDTNPVEWSEPSQYLKSKNLLALDIAEALVYLHSFSSPIIHRDLKAKNVLVNENGDAKLSDFGISREVTLEETMTADVGTVAWIAPEVLQGERYSEKADIYSFGVLLVELDTCQHPYAQHINEDSGVANSERPTNTRIAMRVSAGELVPSLSRDCPESVRRLALQCLSFHAADRPSAVEIHYALRNLAL